MENVMQHDSGPLHEEKGLDLEWQQEYNLKRVDILSIWLRLTEKSEK